MIDPAEQSRLVRAFFHEHLVPAAESLRRRGVAFFPLGPDPAAASYYESYPAGVPPLEELETPQAEAALRALWESQSLRELVAVWQPLVDLAHRLEATEPETDDVSPFIYQMF